jgi:hypothetical protein
MLYPEPTPILLNSKTLNKNNGPIMMCPAFKQMFKNVFSFNSSMEDIFTLPSEVIKEIAFTDSQNERIPVDSKLYFDKTRKSSIDGHINVGYNLAWVMFADEPLEARFTAPYYPNSSPVENSYFSGGQFNIGKWFRQFNLDYHIPIDSKEFKIEEGQPLFFAEFMTDKKVVMKRFQLTPRLSHIMEESSQSPHRYGKLKTLTERYKMAHNAKIPKIVLSEIKKNLID